MLDPGRECLPSAIVQLLDGPASGGTGNILLRDSELK